MTEIIDDVEASTTVEEDVPTSELYRRVALPIQAQMRREAFENEKTLKSFFVAELFNKLNLNRFR